jgi:hypothetical protein
MKKRALSVAVSDAMNSKICKICKKSKDVRCGICWQCAHLKRQMNYSSEYLCDGVWFPVRCEAWKE